MKKISTLPVQNLVDNEGTSSAAPANSPNWDMLAKFQPEPWVPISPRAERLVLSGLALFTALEAYAIYWLLT